jgi:hypothetical protein
LIRDEEQRDWAAVHALLLAAFETSAEARLVDGPGATIRYHPAFKDV